MASVFATASLIFWTRSAGMFAGPYKPKNASATTLTPSSFSVGTSGRTAERLSPVTATIRSLPARWCSIVSDAVSTIIGTCPPSRSCAASAPPL